VWLLLSLKNDMRRVDGVRTTPLLVLVFVKKNTHTKTLDVCYFKKRTAC
jgi:hypothetical protein